MDIEGLGRKNVDLLVDNGLLKSVSDIYRLKKEDLIKLPRFAEKSADNLINAIEKSKEKNLARFVYALGIPNVGEHIAKILVDKFKSLENLMSASKEDLEQIYEIGPEIADSVTQFFKQKRNKEEIEKMKKMGVKATTEIVEKRKAGILNGKTFVFTGTLKDFSRDEAKKLVEELGGRTMSTVSKNTDYLVVGEKPGSKYEKAKKLGITIINEKKFKELTRKTR